MDDTQKDMESQEKPASECAAAPPYTVFTLNERYFITMMVSLVGLFSTLSSPIYLPVLPVLEKKYGVGEKQMNVSVVMYSLFQGLAPSFFSNIADRYGRRLAFFICLVLYLGSNVGLALNNSFAGLLVLRCVQAAGIASTVTVTSGVIADITEKQNRGKYIGLNQGIQLIGQALGGLLGGLVATGFGWRGVFWFLDIASGIVFVTTMLFVPETNRALVGNGSVEPQTLKFFSRAPITFLPRFKRKLAIPHPETIIARRQLNVLDSIKIMRNIAILLVLLPVSIISTGWLLMLTTLSLSLNKLYGFSTLQVGLCYLPSGIGGITGSIIAGRLVDWNYSRLYKKHVQMGCKMPFDTLKARVEVVVYPSLLCNGFLIMFGWCIGKHVHVATVCVSTGFCAFLAIMGMGTSVTILIDIFPNKPSAAAACLNLCRCMMAAVALGVLAYMTEGMTVGGCYSLLAGLGFISSFLYFYILANSRKLLEMNRDTGQ